jgi:hypothetical protein
VDAGSPSKEPVVRHRRLVLVLLSATVTLASGAVAAAAVAAGADAAPARGQTVSALATAPRVAARPVVPHAVVKRVVKAAPKPAQKAAPRPSSRPVTVPPVVRHAAPKAATRVALTPTQLMQQAVARIPGYRQGLATWRMGSGGPWGLTDLYTGVVTISTSVPANRMYDVVAHEWGHVLSMSDYGFDVRTAAGALDAAFGGNGLELAADCMARVLGAQWTNYTACTSSVWRTAAQVLVAGHRL